MDKSTIYRIIPKQFRLRSIAVSLTILLRAMLNFAGLAAMLPVLYLILDAESIHTNSVLESLYNRFGFTSDTSFTLSVCAVIVLFITLKNILGLFLYRYERDFIYALYRFLSRNMYVDYFSRGLQYIKKNNSVTLSRNVNIVCYTFVAGVLKPIASIASEVMLFILIFGAIAVFEPKAALLTAVVFIPSIWIYFQFIRGRVNSYGEQENEAQRKKIREVTESFRGYSDIEISNAFPKILNSFDQTIDTIIRVGRKNATVGLLPGLLTEIGLALGMTALVGICSSLESSDMKILFGVFAVAALRVLPSIRAIMAAWTALKYNRYTIDIISESGISERTLEPEQGTERLEFEHEISTENLCFRFEDSEENLITDLNLKIRKGEKIGISGRSGSGKTTLFNILLGFYPPSSGKILIDGTELNSLSRRKWQNTVGYVSQSVFLKDDTLLANIALGCDRDSIDIHRVEQAIRMASLSQFISKLPNGLESRIGECGALLSGGQRQRIGIARALYKGADVLFFDEATSALDSETEQSINQAIEALSQNDSSLTIVVIAHRETSLRYCDRIIKLNENGI